VGVSAAVGVQAQLGRLRPPSRRCGLMLRAFVSSAHAKGAEDRSSAPAVGVR
jgi:hypothetical protein